MSARQVVLGIGRAVLRFGFGRGEFARAAVDQDRLAHGDSNLHLRNECGLLGSDVRIVEMVVVETNLADGDALGLGHKLREFREGVGSGLVGLLRMDARAGVDVRVREGDVACNF